MSLANLQDVSEALAWTLLHFLWQGMLIGMLYGIAKRLIGDISWQYRFALAALILLLALPAVTFYALLPPGDAALGSAEIVLASMSASQTMPAIDASTAATAAFDPIWTIGLVGIWLVGALVIALRVFGDWRLIRIAIREGWQPPAELSALFRTQLARIGISRPVRLVLTARITTPGVYGLLHPVVLLPIALALGMPKDQLETLLIHELAHIRRADFIGNLLAIAARTLFYFHPVVHWICRDLESSRETLCDDLVVDLDVDRIKYARALSTAEVFRQQVPAPLLTATGGALTWRVHRILALETDKRKKSDRAPLLLALTAIGVSMVGLNSMAPEQLSSIARPDFRAAYGTLMAMAAPEIVVSDSHRTPTRVKLPQLQFGTTPLPVPTTDIESGGTRVSNVDETLPMPTVPATMNTTADITLAPLSESVPLVASDTPPLAQSEATGIELASLPPREAVARKTPSAVIVQRVEPSYPRNARWAGIEGTVTVTYRVDQSGRPVDIRILNATPSGAFEKSTLDAIRRWRFEPGAGTGSARYTQVFDFNLGKDNDGRCETKLGSKICRR